MKRLILAAAVLLAGCGQAAHPAAQDAPPAATRPPAAVAKDPGIAACERAARGAKDKDLPTMAEREANWNRYQRSRYPSLREVGAKLEHAWTAGDLGDQIEAGLTVAITCAAYGVEVDLG